jgi:putative addiction module killer protein
MRARMTEVYRDWIDSVKDLRSRARIQVRVDRLIHGNPGDHRRLAGGVCELKLDFGPGYRVYYAQAESDLIVLLIGGEKSSQWTDIEKAQALASDL